MADTRTIYLHTADTTFSSDPEDTNYTYLDMSEYDSLNPTYSSTIKVSGGVVGIYDDYASKITLTFEGQNSGRDERADWVNKYSHNIKQISVATTPNKDMLFNKRCAVSSIEMIDTNYLNGSQVEIEITLFGRWQSSLISKPTVTEEYEGGTKVYNRHIDVPDITTSGLVGSAYVGYAKVGDTTQPIDRRFDIQDYRYNYQYGKTTTLNQLTLDPDKNRFIIAIDPNYVKGTITLSNGTYSVKISSTNLTNTNGISSDLITYSTGDFDNILPFTLLQSGYVASTVWDNISENYATLYSIINTINTTPADINVSNDAGQHVPFTLLVYSIQDFI